MKRDEDSDIVKCVRIRLLRYARDTIFMINKSDRRNFLRILSDLFFVSFMFSRKKEKEKKEKHFFFFSFTYIILDF